MLRSDLCDYSDAYTVVKGDITVRANNGDNDSDNNGGNDADHMRNKKADRLNLEIMHDLFLPFPN